MVFCAAFLGLCSPLHSREAAAAVEDRYLVVPELCFAPATSPELVTQAQQRATNATVENSLHAGLVNRARLDRRWTTTAMDGFGLLQGDPMTLTWSILPDGTSTSGGVGEPAAASDLRTFLDDIYAEEQQWRQIFRAVFARWAELTGITYIEELNDDGAAFPGSSGALGVRGDVRIGGHLIDGGYGVLAYNYFPNSAAGLLEELLVVSIPGPGEYFVRVESGGQLRVVTPTTTLLD
jgi:hypothetical protein